MVFESIPPHHQYAYDQMRTGRTVVETSSAEDEDGELERDFQDDEALEPGEERCVGIGQ
jgi:hypothetical protein